MLYVDSPGSHVLYFSEEPATRCFSPFLAHFVPLAPNRIEVVAEPPEISSFSLSSPCFPACMEQLSQTFSLRRK